MAYTLFLGPVEKTIDKAGETIRHIKYARRPGVIRAGSFRLAADGPRIGLIEAQDTLLRAIRNDPECVFLCDEPTLDDPISAARLTEWKEAFELRGMPSHWLKAGDTHKDALASLAGVCFTSQRMEGRHGTALPQRLRGAGLDTKWAALAPELQEEVRQAASRFRVKRGDLGGGMSLREALEITSREARKLPVILAGLRLIPDHSYGDRAAASASDVFDTGISANWDNAEGPWNGSVSHTGTVVFSGGSFVTAGMLYSVGSPNFADDQWAQIDGELHKHTVGVQLRANVADRAGYLCMEQSGGTTPTWEIRVYSGAGSVLDSATSTTNGHAILAGDTLTGEVEGTTVRVGSNDSGAGDTERLNLTDATHASGIPGLAVYGANETNLTRIDNWRAGDMAAVAATVTTDMDAAIQATAAKTLGLNAGIAVASLEQVSLDLAVARARTASADLAAAVQAVKAVAASLDASVSAVGSIAVSADMDAAVQALKTRIAGLDAAVQSGRSATASIDVALQAARTLAASLDANISAGGFTIVPAPAVSTSSAIDPTVDVGTALATFLDAAIQQSGALVTSLQAALAKSQTLDASIDAVISAARSSAVNLAAAVQGMAVVAASLDANVSLPGSTTYTVAAALSAALRDTVALSVSLSASIREAGTLSVSLDAGLASTRTSLHSIDAAIAALQSEQAAMDAAVQDAMVSQVSLDARIGTVFAPSRARTYIIPAGNRRH